MAENKNIEVGGRLHSIATGNVLTGANEIFDDEKNKKQSEINVEVDTKLTELENTVDALESQDIVPVDTLPSVVTANPKKIYRLTEEDSYTDYMVNAEGTDWKELATFAFPGIDDEPTAESSNLVKSGGVYSSTPTIANSTTESDLDISDEQGTVLARFAEGHLQVKNFSSADVLDSIQAILSNIGFGNVPEFDEEDDYTIGDIVRYGKYVYVFTSAHVAGEWDDTEVEKTVINTEHPVDVENNENESDLDISDPDGAVILRLKDGHIQTKNFSSSHLITFNKSSIYTYSSDYSVASNLYFKDARKRMVLNENFIPLIIIVGQSNADGRAPYSTLGDFESTEWLYTAEGSVTDYYMWDGTSFAPYGVNTNTGGSELGKCAFDPFFAKSFIQKYNTPLYAIRTSYGGVPIGSYASYPGGYATWNAKEGVFNISNVVYLVLDLMKKVKDADNWALKRNKQLLPVAILWHQGETDADLNLVSEYKQNLSNLLCFMRGIFGALSLPIINGEIINRNQNCSDINAIFQELNQSDLFFKTVSMTGHFDSIDGLHYNADALCYMGEKMFEFYENFNLL